MLIALVSSNRSPLMVIGYVVASVAGSLLGVFLIDVLMRKTGEKGLERFVSKKKLDRMKSKLETKGWITVFIATLLPPPFPFTPVVMTASALQTPRRAIFTAVGVGRLVRFTIEAVLALYFGRRVTAFLNSPVVEYFVYGLIADCYHWKCPINHEVDGKRATSRSQFKIREIAGWEGRLL